jgi:quinol-cytochrome oxidoreductase complex cytochrome b subunit
MASRVHSEHSDTSTDDEIPFFPNHLLSEIALAFAILGLLVVFASLFPVKLAEKYDPLNPPEILEPEWYFMGVYQILKTQGAEPIHSVALLSVLGILLILVPFIDRGITRIPRERPLMMAAALVVAFQFLVLTAYGYATPGQVAQFSDPTFLAVLVIVNAVSLGALAVGLSRQRRIGRGENHA